MQSFVFLVTAFIREYLISIINLANFSNSLLHIIHIAQLKVTYIATCPPGEIQCSVWVFIKNSGTCTMRKTICGVCMYVCTVHYSIHTNTYSNTYMYVIYCSSHVLKTDLPHKYIRMA